MKVILVDDDVTMHVILSKMLHKLPEVQVVGAFTDTKSASFFLQEHTDIGLAFVDISMKGENGMEFAARLGNVGSPVQIVFVTSHKDFALEAYELSVIDYLVKPVSQERLQRTVHRALQNWRAFHPSAILVPPTQQRRGIVITALGDVVVSKETGRVKWISRKCAELFAYLLLYRGRRIPRSKLVTDIFGGMEQAGAESYLNTTVYQLRKSLEPLGMREVIRSENDGYALEWQDANIDYVEFESQVKELHTIDASQVENALSVERLYTGDLFGDKAYVWAIHETERYRQMYTSFVKRLAAVLISSGDTGSASKLLLKLNEHNPLDESVIHHLMMIREMTGDKKGLTVLYTDYVRLLHQELGIRPSEELTALYSSLIRAITDKKPKTAKP
ncbi:response regulator [Paenibacillus chondroitinus]|uniref:Response regulator n=1 Tax=Paenibacillus chondroitinus TaxID=59842 RepID=A0ABU6DCB8_9BACL|nr:MULTISPECIES: response regulator [Paenibacillus]MCY9659981.1 response regulator [Paenibacillus anseongense]MEB4795401.1 response regulator [Paenibacillus chondroitinus]